MRLLLLYLGISASCLIGAMAQASQPNILFILTDDLGYGDIGALFQNTKEGAKHRTPHLDQMAAEGMTLTRHYTPAPVCAPCRASLLLGVHQGHSNIRNNQFDEELADNHALASTLQTLGYATACIGKWGVQGEGGGPENPLGWAAYPLHRGFDFFHGYVDHVGGHQHYPANEWPMGNSKKHQSPQNLYEGDAEISAGLDKCYTTDLFTARAKKLIIDEANDGDDQPFFLYLAYDTPHAALQLPTGAYPTGGGLEGGIQWEGAPGKMINTASGEIDSYVHPDYAGQGWTNTEERFATSVRRIDDAVGDLRQLLQDLEIAEQTLIVFTSDNGPLDVSYIPKQPYQPTTFASYGPFEGIKRDCSEGGIRMPLLAAWPGTIEAGSSSDLPSQFHDWLPTFVRAAGGTPPARTDGVSLLPTLTGEGEQREPTVYIEYSTNGKLPSYEDFPNHAGEPRKQNQVIYLDGYKGIRKAPKDHSTPFAIYDTLTDLKEANDLADTSDKFRDLEQRMRHEVLRVRQIHPSAERPWDKAHVEPLTPDVVNGVTFAAFEGTWPWIPDFAGLTPVASGHQPAIDLSNLSRSEDAGLQFTGYLRIPEEGEWTFYASSDAGTHLRIHRSQVIDDDFTHDGEEVGGSMLLKAGDHPFTLSYRTGDAAPSLTLSWSGPGVTKQPIPEGALYRDTDS